MNRKVAATGNFIEVASSANDGAVGTDESHRFVLRSLQGKSFRGAVILKDAAALERDAVAKQG